tara:strand:+ start:601 stop:1650 length:1050 start_codon:yes stop_codon:yes gene_type:complete
MLAASTLLSMSEYRSNLVSRRPQTTNQRPPTSDEYESMMAVLKNDGMFASRYPGIHLPKDLAMAAVGSNGAALSLDALKEYTNDRDVVERAVQQNWRSFQFAGTGIRGKYDTVKMAVQTDWRTIQWAGPRITDDRVSMMDMVSVNPMCFIFASPELRGDRPLVMQAVEQKGDLLDEAISFFKKDRVLQSTAALTSPRWALILCHRIVSDFHQSENALMERIATISVKRDLCLTLFGLKGLPNDNAEDRHTKVLEAYKFALDALMNRHMPHHVTPEGTPIRLPDESDGSSKEAYDEYLRTSLQRLCTNSIMLADAVDYGREYQRLRRDFDSYSEVTQNSRVSHRFPVSLK